ncbi:hypothetical protein H2248_010242 [Termitomyces sp. 'cryptogamus']|nr:hypothetical protein H2248_010242 [Termitomyces sp. 'cryptogamus']
MRRSFPPIKSSIFSPLVKAAEKFRSRGSERQVLSEVVPPKEPTRRALLVAINYPNLPHLDRLEGPQRDVEKLRDILINRYQYQQELITILTDKEGISATYYPTRENVLKHLRHFYDGQTPGDQYLFYFAGHSFQYDTEDKREEDRKDEFLLPSIDRETFEKLKEDTEKYKDYGIVDDVLAEYLVKPLNDTSRLTAIFDTCHSNTLLDLPHHRCNRVYNCKSLFRRAKRRCILNPPYTAAKKTHIFY